MPTLQTIIRHLHGPALPHDLSDGQLLDRFLARRDESAFELLVRRHGPMVLGVCRRVLRHTQDVEDAFQATFVVLVRRAHAVVPRENVANWLYGVAYRTALKARALAARRRVREREVVEMPETEAAGRERLAELEQRLDRELSALPDAYRMAIILCDLEGKTRKEAAKQLGWAEGTVASRLARGRSLLASRLSRQGMMVPAGVLAAALAERAAACGLPPMLVADTIRAGLASTGLAAAGALPANVAALSEGVLRTMLLNKIKIATAVLVACALLGIGGVAVSQRAQAEKPADKPTVAEQPTKAPEALATKPAIAPIKDAAVPEFISGVVTAVDADHRVVSVAHRNGEDTFRVAKDAKIQINWKPGHLTLLPKGANVMLSKFSDASTAGDVHATGRSYFNARVLAVDTAKRTISIKDRDEEKSFPVADDACVSVDGRHCKLESVPTGARVNVGLAADQRTAINIGCDGDDLGGCAGSPVKSVDTALNTITFDEGGTPDVSGKTFTLAKDAQIMVDGKPATLTSVPPGCFVTITLRVDGQLVGRLNAQGPSNVCDCGGSQVTAIDVEKGTITFGEKARAEVAGKTFALAKGANIVIDGGPGKLDNLPVGSYVQMSLLTDRQTVGMINATGAAMPGLGLVKAVDAEKGNVSIDDTTYPVAKNANILVDGKTVSLSGVRPGIYVTVRFCVDQKTVGSLFHAKAP